MSEKPLVNRVAASGLITLNLEEFYPSAVVESFDVKEYLFHGLVLKEKDFREALAIHDWKQYEGKYLAVFCSTDAIVPVWAYQLVAIHAAPFAKDIVFGNKDRFLEVYYYKALAQLDLSTFNGQRIVIKGCSDKPVPPAAYTEMARLLQPIAKSIMYGEPCSTVPLYKQGKGE